MKESCSLPPPLLSLPAVQVVSSAQGDILYSAVTHRQLLAAEGSLAQQVSPSKAEQINGLNLEGTEMPGWFSCHATDTSSFPCKESRRDACDMLSGKRHSPAVERVTPDM